MEFWIYFGVFGFNVKGDFPSFLLSKFLFFKENSPNPGKDDGDDGDADAYDFLSAGLLKFLDNTISCMGN